MIVSEPLLAPILANQRWLRPLIYALIVGGLVAAPVWRLLAPSHRMHVATITVLIVWLVTFGWLDDLLVARLDPMEAWVWDESIVDFVRWLGWIPVVVTMQRRFGARATAPAAPE
jgi:hypothetical protein